MQFKHDMVKGITSQGKICSLDNERNRLNLFGVEGNLGYFGLANSIDLTKIGLFDCFEEDNEDRHLNYLRLRDFFYLANERRYLAITQQLPLTRKPITSISRETEEIVVFQNLTKRGSPESPEYQHFGLIKLNHEMEVVQKSTLKFPTNERITTSITNGSLVILRAKIEQVQPYNYTQFNEFSLEFFDSKTLEKDNSRDQPRRFSFEGNKLTVSRFIYQDPGHLLLLLSRFRSSEKSDVFKTDCLEYRDDRVSLNKVVGSFVEENSTRLLWLLMMLPSKKKTKKKRKNSIILKIKKKKKEKEALQRNKEKTRKSQGQA